MNDSPQRASKVQVVGLARPMVGVGLDGNRTADTATQPFRKPMMALLFAAPLLFGADSPPCEDVACRPRLHLAPIEQMAGKVIEEASILETLTSQIAADGRLHSVLLVEERAGELTKNLDRLSLEIDRVTPLR